jgi:osmotically-inducible protein OsmY
MRKIASISEMQKFHFGAKITCDDGEDGSLAQVIFDASTRRMTHLGVKQRRLFGHTVYLPGDIVVKATGEGVIIRAKLADVAAGSSTSVSGAILDNKSVVENAAITGNAGSSGGGRLMLVALHPESLEVAYLVVHDLRPGHDTLIQAEYIADISTGYIKVNVPDTTLNALPPYRPDSVLQQEVEAVLFGSVPLRIDLKGITARVLDGVLYLDGNISSLLRGDIAQDQALGISGILEVKNHLVGDDGLASDLAMALGRDERTRDLPIGVYPRLGVVRLSGAVHNGQQKAAAEEIARSFAGVRSAINDLLVNPKANLLYVMSPAEGGETEDKVPGKYIRHTK